MDDFFVPSEEPEDSFVLVGGLYAVVEGVIEVDLVGVCVEEWFDVGHEV